MVAIRVIPCLDVNAGRVVKGTNFVDLRDAGDPVEIAKIYISFFVFTSIHFIYISVYFRNKYFIPAHMWNY